MEQRAELLSEAKGMHFVQSETRTHVRMTRDLVTGWVRWVGGGEAGRGQDIHGLTIGHTGKADIRAAASRYRECVIMYICCLIVTHLSLVTHYRK